MLAHEHYYCTGKNLARTRVTLGASRNRLATLVGCRKDLVALWEGWGADRDLHLYLRGHYAGRLRSALRGLCEERLTSMRADCLPADLLAGTDLKNIIDAFTENMPNEYEY